jgi:hypothetical protein
MDKNTCEVVNSAGSDKDGYLNQLLSAKGINDKQLELQLAQLLKSTLSSLYHLNPDIIKSLTSEVFLAATSYNGSVSKSRRVLDCAKTYFHSVSSPCSSDAHIFHCIAFYVQAESEEKDITKGIRNILEHRETLIAFPDPLRDSVIASACDGFTFGDKQTTLDYINTISLHHDLLVELPVEVTKGVISKATEHIGINYQEAYAKLNYKGEKLRAARRYRAEADSRSGFSLLSLSQVDSIFSEFDHEMKLGIDDLPKVFSFVASRKNDLQSVSPRFRQTCTEQVISLFRLNGYAAPSFLDNLFVLARKFPRYSRRLEDIFGRVESLYTQTKNSDYADWLLQCFLDRPYFFSLSRIIFDEVLEGLEMTFKEVHKQHWPDPHRLLERTLKIMDYDTDFVCSFKGRGAKDAFSKLILLSIIKGDDVDGVEKAKVIIDFVKDKRLYSLQKTIVNYFIQSACNLSAYFGGALVELLPILLKIFTKDPEELVKDLSDEDIVALKNAAMTCKDRYLLNLARKLEREEQPDHLRMIDENIDDN